MTNTTRSSPATEDMQTRIGSLEVELQIKDDEISALRAELGTARKKLDRYGWVRSGLAKVFSSMYFGVSVTRAISAIEKSYTGSTDKPLLQRVPMQQWLNLLLAFLNRQFLTIFLLGLAAAVPPLLTFLLMREQNEKIDKQIYLSQQSMASQFTSQIAELLSDIPKSAREICLDKEKLKKKVTTIGDLMLAPCWSDMAHSSPDDRAMWQAKRAELAGDITRRDYFVEVAQDARAWQADKLAITDFVYQGFGAVMRPAEDIAARAKALTNALPVYRLLVESVPGERQDSSPVLTDRAFSPERGLILQQFLQYNLAPAGNYRQSFVDSFEISDVKANFLNLRDSLIRCSTFRNTDLSGSDLKRVKLRNSMLIRSNLWRSDWTMASLEGVEFEKTVMPAASQFRVHSLKHVKFKEVFVASKSWPNEVAETARDFDPASVVLIWNSERKSFVMSTKESGDLPFEWSSVCSNFDASRVHDMW